MSDKQVFDAAQLFMIEFKFIRGQVDIPEDFETKLVEGYQLENSLQPGFNIKEKLVKADFIIELKTDSRRTNVKEATGSFHLVFIFRVENLDELVHQNKNTIKLNPDLGNAIAAITYSTSRGILLMKLQGTPFQHFILPVINPNKLLHSGKH